MNWMQRTFLVVGSLGFFVYGFGHIAGGLSEPWELGVGWLAITVTTACMIFAFKSGNPKHKGDA